VVSVLLLVFGIGGLVGNFGVLRLPLSVRMNGRLLGQTARTLAQRRAAQSSSQPARSPAITASHDACCCGPVRDL
jgi:hypothetical protein